MEFLLYLSSIGRDVYSLVSQKVRVLENAPICRKHDIYGWFQTDQSTLVICTDKIKSGGDAKHYINETLLHEAVHVAQSCKHGSGLIGAFGISLAHMPLSENRKTDLNTAVSISGEQVRYLEHEAFWMEDKPNKVKYVLQKYCF